MNGPGVTGTARMTAITPQTRQHLPVTPPIPYQSYYHGPFQTEFGYQPWTGHTNQAVPNTPPVQQWQTPSENGYQAPAVNSQGYQTVYPQVEPGQQLVVLPYHPQITPVPPSRALSRTLPPIYNNVQPTVQPTLPPLEPAPVLPPDDPRSPVNYQLYPTYTSTPRDSPATILLQCDHDELREKMIERRKEIRSLNSQRHYWAQHLFLFERNRLTSQLEGLCRFENAPIESFASAQQDYFDLLAQTDYHENTGILGPLTILLKLEEVVATMTAEYQWCRNVLTNAGVSISSDESTSWEEVFGDVE